MKQTRLPLAALLVLTLAACSKKSDPAANSGTTPTYKSHTLVLGYNNRSLDKNNMNLGAAIRVFVDNKPVMLGSAVDTAYYLSPFDSNGTATYPKTLTVSGAKLTLEIGFYNVYGTVAQPKDGNGRTMTINPNAYLSLSPTVDGQPFPPPYITLGGGLNASLRYDNGKNPTRIMSYDLTKL